MEIEETLVYKTILSSKLYENEIAPILNKIKENTTLTVGKISAMESMCVIRYDDRMSYKHVYTNDTYDTRSKIIDMVLGFYGDEYDNMKDIILSNRNDILGNLEDTNKNICNILESLNHMIIDALIDKIEWCVSNTKLINHDILVEKSIQNVMSIYGSECETIKQMIDEMRPEINRYVKMLRVSK